MTAVAERPDPAVASPPAPETGRPPQAYRPHVPGWWRDVAGVLTWASMLVVVALWVAGGNVQDLTGWGTGLTAVGRWGPSLAGVCFLALAAVTFLG